MATDSGIGYEATLVTTSLPLETALQLVESAWNGSKAGRKHPAVRTSNDSLPFESEWPFYTFVCRGRAKDERTELRFELGEVLVTQSKLLMVIPLGPKKIDPLNVWKKTVATLVAAVQARHQRANARKYPASI